MAPVHLTLTSTAPDATALGFLLLDMPEQVCEYALGTEALERWTLREPLRRVHEAVFAILALESEPVEPRL